MNNREDLIRRLRFYDEYSKEDYQCLENFKVLNILECSVWVDVDGESISLPLSQLRTDSEDLYLPLWLYEKKF